MKKNGISSNEMCSIYGNFYISFLMRNCPIRCEWQQQQQQVIFAKAGYYVMQFFLWFTQPPIIKYIEW